MMGNLGDISSIMNREKRRGIRVPLEVPIEFRPFGNGSHHAITEDFSTRGVGIRSADSIGVGKQCHLVFALPPHQEKTEMTGEVRWEALGGPTGRIGIQFLRPFDVSVLFAATEQSLRKSRQQTQLHFDRLYRTLSDACVWVNSKGEIVRHDERFLTFLGYAEGEVAGRSLSEFAHREDKERLEEILVPKQTGVPSISTDNELFRMERKDGPPLFWKIRVPAKAPWASTREVYIEHMTEFRAMYIEHMAEFRALKDEKYRLEQMVGALKRSVYDHVVVLASDLSIIDVNGFETAPQEQGAGTFSGMDLREATGLVETKLNGRTLWDQLLLCAKTGAEYSIARCVYEGRAGSGRDLFTPGTFGIRIRPLPDMNGKVTWLFMVVRRETSGPGRMRKERQSLSHLPHNLAAAATGFVLKDVLKEVCDPFTCVVARLDLLRYKLSLEKGSPPSGNGAGLGLYEKEIQEVGQVIEDLGKRFKFLVENTYSPEPVLVNHFDINECFARAISIVTMYEELGAESIRFEPESALPTTALSEQESITIFLVFLLLARDCVRTVSEKTIKCETKRNQSHIIMSIYHNGYIQQGKYLDILFDNDPLESYFFKVHSSYFMDTLLYYGNLLLKKNDIKIRINNVPGQFSLSLFIPFGSSATQSE